jgi:hypothetical protein
VVCIPEGKNQLENQALDGHNIGMDLKEAGCDDVYWIHLTWDRDK